MTAGNDRGDGGNRDDTDGDGRTPSTMDLASWRSLPAFGPYDALLARLTGEPTWPPVTRLRLLLGADIDFVVPAGRLPAGLDDSDVDGSYIGWCVAGRVPTRERNLHDLMNALTWARFPAAKMALCRRQVAVARARGRHTNRLRTREQDRLAMLDEGGILVVGGGTGTGGTSVGEVTFGHGLLEDLVRGRTSRGLRLPVDSADDDGVARAMASVLVSDLRS